MARKTVWAIPSFVCTKKTLLMSIHPFSFANCCLLLISAGLLLYFIFLWQYLKQKTPPATFNTFKKPVLRFAGLYALYLLAICLLAGAGFFTVITTPPRFLLIFVPIAGIIVLLSRAKLNGGLGFLSIIPPLFLVGVHVMRILIELVFLRFADEKIIPVELSFHGRNVDLLVGALAIPVSLLFIKKHSLARKAGIVFNVLGLLSLANIFSLVIPSLPSTFRVYDTFYLPTYFPGVLIVFLASSAICVHILSLRQLWARKHAVRMPEVKMAGGKPLIHPA
jgi:hypothetical protein